MNRREILKLVGMGGLHASIAGLGGLSSLAFAQNYSNSAVVLLTLGGGCDGLSMLVPSAPDDRDILFDSEDALRPDLFPDTVKDIPDDVLENTIVEKFKIHGACDFSDEDYQHITFFPATHAGNIDLFATKPGNTSHFSAQEIVDLGGTGNNPLAMRNNLGLGNKKLGWVARLNQLITTGSEIPIFSFNKGLSISGDNSILSLSSVVNGMFHHSIGSINRTMDNEVLREVWRNNSKHGAFDNKPAFLNARTRHENYLAKASAAESAYSNYSFTADWTGLDKSGGIGDKLRQTAAILKGVDGLQFVNVIDGSYDHHAGLKENISTKLELLSKSLSAFRQEMKNSDMNIEVIVLTEFGRTVDQNDAPRVGTDHGQAFTAFVMGAGGSPTKLKRVCYGERNNNLGAWPGLDKLVFEANGRHQLNPITDYRDILVETLQNTILSMNAESIFKAADSGYSEQALNFITTPI